MSVRTAARTLISRSTFASSSRLTLPILASSTSRAATRLSLPPRTFISPPRFASTSTSPSTASSSSTSPPGLPPIPPNPSVDVIPPSLDAIKEEGYLDDDVQLLPPDQASIKLTPEAVQQLVNITSREPPDVLQKGKLALRVGVESGGCHGYQYTMALTEERGADDYVIQPRGVQCIPVVVDLVSLGLLKGATLHHATELIGSSFRLQDNPQAKEGGACGCGVSWEAKA